MFKLQDIPLDVEYLIVKFLEIEDLCNLLKTSKYYYNLFNDKYIWSYFMNRDFDIDGDKNDYIKLYKFYKNYNYKTYNDVFVAACLCRNFDVINILIKHKDVDPSLDDSILIDRLYDDFHYEVLKIILKDCRADPSTYDNNLIKKSYEKKSKKVVKLLLEDERVRSSLSDEERLRYKLFLLPKLAKKMLYFISKLLEIPYDTTMLIYSIMNKIRNSY